MAKPCKILHDQIKAGESGYKSEVITKIKTYLNTMLPEISDQEISNATGGKRLKLEKARELYDTIYLDILNVSALSNYEMDPDVYLQSWQNYLYGKNNLSKVTPKDVKNNYYRANSLLNIANAVIKKRKNNFDKMKAAKGTNKLPWFQRAIMPPSILMFKWEIFGYGNQHIIDVQANKDNIQQLVSTHFDPIAAAHTELGNYVMTQIESGNIDINSFGNYGFYIITEENSEDRVKEKEDILYSKRVHITKPYEEIAEELETYGIYNKDQYNHELAKSITDRLTDDIRSGEVQSLQAFNYSNISPDLMKNVQTKDPIVVMKAVNEIVESRINLSKLLGDEGNPYIHSIDYDGKTYFYTIVKSHKIREQITLGNEADLQNLNEDILAKMSQQKFKTWTKEDETGYAVFTAYKDQASGELVGLLSGKNQIAPETLNQIIKPGLYKSQKQRQFNINSILNKQPFYRSFYRQYERMENNMQDNVYADLMDKVWKMTVISRERLFNSFLRQQKMNLVQERRLQNLEAQIVMKLKEEGVAEEDIPKAVDDMFMLEEINTTGIWRDKAGSLRTGYTGFKMITGEYSPVQFHGDDIRRMVMAELRKIENEIEDAEKANNQVKLEELQEMKQHFIYILEPENDDVTDEVRNQMKIARRSVFAEPRRGWTDHMLRRKDFNLLRDYFHNTFEIANNNRMVALYLEVALKMKERGVSQDVQDYIRNKTKQAINSARTYGNFKDYGSWEWAAGVLNNSPKIIKGNRDWNAERVKNVSARWGAYLTARFLGTRGAMVNNTQIANNFIHWGWGSVKEAWQLIGTEEWQDIIRNTGALNIISMFENFMVKDEEVKMMDFGFIPGTGMPSHNLMRTFNLLSKGREKFITESDAEIDGLLKRLSAKSGGEARSNIETLRGLFKEMRGVQAKEAIDKLKNKYGENWQKTMPEEEAKLMVQRAAYYDLMTLTEVENKEELIKKRIISLVGQVSDQQIKKMVNWKLSWWFSKKLGPEVFTFSGAEVNMRSLTVIMALKEAERQGLLEEEKGKFKNVYKTDKAIKIARDAVYATMFGMSPEYLGDMFDGVGKNLMQFKSYPLFQTKHDWDLMHGFWKGGGQLSRLMKAHLKLGTKVWENASGTILPNNHLVKKGLGDDPQAEAMLRFMWTRGIASIGASLISTIPLIGKITNLIPGGQLAWSTIRGAESPLLAVAARTMVWGALFMYGADDDMDDENSEMFNLLMMITFPALLGVLVRDITDVF